MWYCYVYKSNSTVLSHNSVRASEIHLLPCQNDLLHGLERSLIKPVVQMAQQRHIPEHLLLHLVSNTEGGWAGALAYSLPPLTGTLRCFWKPSTWYIRLGLLPWFSDPKGQDWYRNGLLSLETLFGAGDSWWKLPMRAQFYHRSTLTDTPSAVWTSPVFTQPLFYWCWSRRCSTLCCEAACLSVPSWNCQLGNGFSWSSAAVLVLSHHPSAPRLTVRPGKSLVSPAMGKRPPWTGHGAVDKRHLGQTWCTDFSSGYFLQHTAHFLACLNLHTRISSVLK